MCKAFHNRFKIWHIFYSEIMTAINIPMKTVIPYRILRMKYQMDLVTKIFVNCYG